MSKEVDTYKIFRELEAREKTKNCKARDYINELDELERKI